MGDKSMNKYCQCGQVIKIPVRGIWRPPSDDAHDLCRQCWESKQDSNRIKPPLRQNKS